MIDTFDATTHGFPLIAVRFERVGCRFGSGIVRPTYLKKTRSVRGVVRPCRQTFVFWHIIAPACLRPACLPFGLLRCACSAGSVGRSLHPLRCCSLVAVSATLPPSGCKGYRPRLVWLHLLARKYYPRVGCRLLLSLPPAFWLPLWPRLLPARNTAFSALFCPFLPFGGVALPPEKEKPKIWPFLRLWRGSRNHPRQIVAHTTEQRRTACPPRAAGWLRVALPPANGCRY